MEWFFEMVKIEKHLSVKMVAYRMKFGSAIWLVQLNLAWQARTCVLLAQDTGSTPFFSLSELLAGKHYRNRPRGWNHLVGRQKQSWGDWWAASLPIYAWLETHLSWEHWSACFENHRWSAQHGTNGRTIWEAQSIWRQMTIFRSHYNSQSIARQGIT